MSVQVEKWDYFELPLQFQEVGNPYLDVTLTERESCAPPPNLNRLGLTEKE